MSQVRALGYKETGVAEQLQMPGLATAGLAHPFGDQHTFAKSRCKDRQNPVRVPLISSPQNHGPCAIGMAAISHVRLPLSSIGIEQRRFPRVAEIANQNVRMNTK